MTMEGLLAGARWRKSSFSGSGDPGNGDCVEAAHLAEGSVAVRDSKNPDGSAVVFAPAAMHSWIRSIESGQFG